MKRTWEKKKEQENRIIDLRYENLFKQTLEFFQGLCFPFAKWRLRMSLESPWVMEI